MALVGFARDRFEQVLKERLSATKPIRSAEFLRGRERKLEDIRRALVADGRHIFVYGDRGVGKTSLAQTAAFEHQSADQRPILLACDTASGFYRLAHDLASALVQSDPTISKRTNSRKMRINIRSLLSGEVQEAIERGTIPEMRSINEVVSVIDFAAKRHSRAPVIVIDEFERVKASDDRMLFADFIKQIGDQSIPLKLIFCGVGTSLNDLLDAHHSCYRYLAAVHLERLGYDHRLAIIDDARVALGLEMDDATRYRIAIISDGYPHYVHLVCEKMFWESFQDQKIVSRVTPDHFAGAIEAAVRDIEPQLKTTYERAIRKYNDEYEEILWATADTRSYRGEVRTFSRPTKELWPSVRRR